MLRKAAFLSLFVAILAGLPSSSGPSLRPAGAQVPMFFGATRAPAIDVDGSDRIYVMMSVATKPASARTPGSQIFFTQSFDYGATWDNMPATRNLSKSDGEAFGPYVAITKSGTARAYVVYHDNKGGTTQAYLIRSKKKAKFRVPVNITPGDGGAFSPRIALGSGESVNVVWGDTSNLTRQVIFVRSTDLGESFAEPVNVSRSEGGGFDPEIAIDGNDVIYVVWEDATPGTTAIFLAKSTDRGSSFSDPVRVSKGSGRATEAHIAVDSSNRLHVVWVDESTGEPQGYYARSTDGGATFSEPINVSHQPEGDIHKPYVTTYGSSVFVAYHNEGRRNRQVFLTRSEDEGRSFGEPVQISQANGVGRAHSPAMVCDSTGRLHIVWIDTSIVGNDEGLMFYSSSRNFRTFTPQFMILAAIP